jgi:hypothetical protein
MTPTSRERMFLRAIAAPNSHKRTGEEAWWSVDDLRTTTLFPDFRGGPDTTMVIAGIAKSCVRKGMAESRRIGTHGWTEWRVTSFGRGCVSDSCIGGGLPWKTTDPFRCPACQATAPELATLLGAELSPAEIPAHPLPGYAPTENSAPGGN